MHKGLIFTIGTLLGGAVGTAAGFVIARKKTENEIEDVRRYYRDKAAGKVPVWEKKATPTSATTEAKPSEKKDEDLGGFGERSSIDASNPYTPVSSYMAKSNVEVKGNIYTSQEKSQKQEDIKKAKEIHSKYQEEFFKHIEPITYDEFRELEESDKYSIYRLTYFALDDLVVDEENEYNVPIITEEQIESFGGLEAVKYHPEYPEGETAFYFNKDRYSLYSLTVITDYECSRDAYDGKGSFKKEYPDWCSDIQRGAITYDEWIELYGLDDCRVMDPRL